MHSSATTTLLSLNNSLTANIERELLANHYSEKIIGVSCNTREEKGHNLPYMQI